MLSVFNRFLSRMRSAHPVFGEKKILIIILEFLEGQELFQMFQVCYSFRKLIQAVPILEITLLKYTIAQSNKYIENLRNSSDQIDDKFHVKNKGLGSVFLFKYFKKNEPKKSVHLQINERKSNDKDFIQDKWVNFQSQFHMYAQNNGLKILKREDFDDEKQWKDYKMKYLTYYHNYVDYIKDQKEKGERLKAVMRNAFFNYRNFVEKLDYSFHSLTNYRFLKPSSDPILVPKKK